MNPSVILALISDLYNQIALLTEDNQKLRQALEAESTPGT